MECYTLAAPLAAPRRDTPRDTPRGTLGTLRHPLATPLRCEMECGGVRPDGAARLEGDKQRGDKQRVESEPAAPPQWPRLPPRAASHLLPLLLTRCCSHASP